MVIFLTKKGYKSIQMTGVGQKERRHKASLLWPVSCQQPNQSLTQSSVPQQHSFTGAHHTKQPKKLPKPTNPDCELIWHHVISPQTSSTTSCVLLNETHMETCSQFFWKKISAGEISSRSMQPTVIPVCLQH